MLPGSAHKNYADDLVLPRAEDGNGFGAGRKPPGGYIVRVDPDGKNAELFASGQRNNYDIAFNADGELFGWDSDMEWDWGTPWYRPIRAFHAVSGGDTGFGEGSAKRHALEAFHGQADPAALDLVRANLNSPDRFIRYAARIAMERQPVDQWKALALEEKQPAAAMTALLALARLGTNDLQADLFKA